MTEIGQYFDSKHNMVSVAIELYMEEHHRTLEGVETGQRITYSGISGWILKDM